MQVRKLCTQCQRRARQTRLRGQMRVECLCRIEVAKDRCCGARDSSARGARADGSHPVTLASPIQSPVAGSATGTPTNGVASLPTDVREWGRAFSIEVRFAASSVIAGVRIRG